MNKNIPKEIKTKKNAVGHIAPMVKVTHQASVSSSLRKNEQITFHKEVACGCRKIKQKRKWFGNHRPIL